MVSPIRFFITLWDCGDYYCILFVIIHMQFFNIQGFFSVIKYNLSSDFEENVYLRFLFRLSDSQSIRCCVIYEIFHNAVRVWRLLLYFVHYYTYAVFLIFKEIFSVKISLGLINRLGRFESWIGYGTHCIWTSFKLVRFIEIRTI